MKLGVFILAAAFAILAARGLSATIFGPQSLSHNRVMSSPRLPEASGASSRRAAPASPPVHIDQVKGFGARAGG